MRTSIRPITASEIVDALNSSNSPTSFSLASTNLRDLLVHIIQKPSNCNLFSREVGAGVFTPEETLDRVNCSCVVLTPRERTEQFAIIHCNIEVLPRRQPVKVSLHV